MTKISKTKHITKTGIIKNNPSKKEDIVGLIISYEGGELSDSDTLKLFSELIRTGQAWKLQGHYGRTASALIDSGFISKDGKILRRGI